MAERYSYNNMGENGNEKQGQKPFLKGDEHELRPIDYAALNKISPPTPPQSAKIVDIPLAAETQKNEAARTAAYATSDMISDQAVAAMGNENRQAPTVLPNNDIHRHNGWSKFRRLGAAGILLATTGAAALGIMRGHDNSTSQEPHNSNPADRNGSQIVEGGVQSMIDAKRLVEPNNTLQPSPRPESTDQEKNK